MNKGFLNLDLRSLIIGFLLALVAFLVLKGASNPVQADGSEYAIAATDDGVYILRDGNVVFREKAECRKLPGCSIHVIPK